MKSEEGKLRRIAGEDKKAKANIGSRNIGGSNIVSNSRRAVSKGKLQARHRQRSALRSEVATMINTEAILLRTSIHKQRGAPKSQKD